MNTYLLLRNNRESGPFTRDQLLQLGLKAYDLVWVEGKSAAWRYPSEVTDLKDFAPVVEEQPYDRFFKKKAESEAEQEHFPAETKKNIPAQVEHSVLKEEYSSNGKGYSLGQKENLVQVKDYSSQEQEHSFKKEENFSKEKEYASGESEYSPRESDDLYKEYQPKQKEYTTTRKAVSVIMPPQSAAKKPEPVYAFVPGGNTVSSVKAVDSDLETNYSVPLDEIKEKYVRQLQERKQRTAHKKFLFQNLKRAAIFLLIIGSGVLIGFAIKPKRAAKNNLDTTSSANMITPASMEAAAKKGVIPADSVPFDAAASAAVKQEADNSTRQVNNDNREPVDKKKVEEPISLEKNNPEQVPVTNSTTGERTKLARKDESNDPAEKRIEPGADLTGQVAIKANDYRLRDFGGFRNLELTVTNDSKVALENVLVELQYLKINDDPIKVEHIPFRSISPGGTLTIRIPDNNRGAKLTYKIIKIDPRN